MSATCGRCGQELEFSDNPLDGGGEWLHFVGPWMVGEACPSAEAVEHFSKDGAE